MSPPFRTQYHATTTNTANYNPQTTITNIPIALNSNRNPNDSSDINTNELSKEYLDKASKLRKEVEQLESNTTRLSKEKQQQQQQQRQTDVSYATLDDSMWIISYRFSSDPISQGNDNENNDNDKNGDTTPTVNTFYSGKIPILLKGDGYTELLNIESDSNINSKNNISFQKMWGWDEELSREDGDDAKTFLSFSADILLPPSDINYNPKQPDTPSRFYFNAQVETNSKNGEISLKDGTVTLKRDVASPAGGGGFWGIFNAGGILAQFRYCGEFLMKLTSP